MGGVQIGKPGTGWGSTYVANPNSNIEPIDSATIISNSLRFYKGETELTVSGSITAASVRTIVADSLNALRNAAVQIEDVAVMLLPDTVHVTSATYTILVTDANKRVYFTDNFCLITLPSDATAAIPVGTTINVMSYGWLMKFQAGANAVLKAPKDSVTTSNTYDRVGLEKTAANKWTIYGALKD
jgi:hypothetical protein